MGAGEGVEDEGASRVADADGEQAVSTRFKESEANNKDRRICIPITPFLKLYTVPMEMVPEIKWTGKG